MTVKVTAFERRLDILFFIENRKHTSVPELASYFSVSERTAYRDVMFLSRYAPIFTKQGMYGGIFMLDDYKNAILLHLTEDEKKLLIKLSKSLSGIDAMRMYNIINKFSMPDTPSST